jgi:PIN domain nuclease of toxin-antitoxin system
VKLLLDTHVFLWLQTEPERLGHQLPLVEDARTTLLLSAVSSWEIAIKHGLGRLPLPEPPERYVPDRMRTVGAHALSIDHTHALAVSTLPPLHRDPFDRLLIAQARVEDIPVLTADRALARYPVETLVVGAQG